jgi:hypothetical protein
LKAASANCCHIAEEPVATNFTLTTALAGTTPTIVANTAAARIALNLVIFKSPEISS